MSDQTNTRPLPFRSPLIAHNTLRGAAQAIQDPELVTAGQTYALAAGLWATYLQGLAAMGRTVQGQDVLQMTGLLAMAKTITGDPTNPAHYVEQAACAAGAAALANAQLPLPPNSAKAPTAPPQGQEQASSTEGQPAAVVPPGQEKADDPVGEGTEDEISKTITEMAQKLRPKTVN